MGYFMSDLKLEDLTVEKKRLLTDRNFAGVLKNYKTSNKLDKSEIVRIKLVTTL